MKSRAAIFGHPLHPMLVGMPIGMFIWALIADFVYLGTGKNVMWYDIAFWTGFIAWISALGAALPGFVDYLFMAIRSDARMMATGHMLFNVSIVVLFLVATILGWDHGALAGGRLTAVIVLQAIGVGILGLSGWLGGEMIFRHHLAMVPDDSELEAAEQRRHSEGWQRMGPRHA